MSIRQLETRALEKIWGRNDIPAMFGQAGQPKGAIGEIWFEDSPDSALLIKYLFTSQKLSIQVHPSDEQARKKGYLRGKEEAWYVLSADPDAAIGAGFDAELSPQALRDAVMDGSIEALLTWHPVKPGDFFYVPAGTVHAIGAGLSLLEIQQNVDLTYRLFDYGRPRELQVEEGLAVSQPRPIERRPFRAINAFRDVLAEGPKIVIERLRGAVQHDVPANIDVPVWLMPISDDCMIDDVGVAAGTVWMADAPVQVRLCSDSCLLVAYSGDKVRL